MSEQKDTKPTLLRWLLSRMIADKYLEELLGDMDEMYDQRVASKSKGYASIMRWIDAFHLMMGFSSIRYVKYKINQLSLLKNYFKISRRNIIKHKFYSAINVIGLATGISMSLLIYIHVSQEFSYETTYPKHKQIYRLASTSYAAKSPIMGLEFKEQIPEVKEMARLFSFEPVVLSYKKEDQLIKRPFLADHALIEMFDLEFIEGNPATALQEPSSIILTESVANRLFKPGEKRIGEVVDFDDGWRQKVTGIIKDFPQNTHLKLDCISSMKRSYIGQSTDRLWAAVSIYVLFNSEEDAKRVEEKLLDFQIQFYNGMAPYEEIRQQITESGEFLELHPITDIHLRSHRKKEIEANSDVIFVYVFCALAIFILLVVIINFINLYIAQTLNRIKEIGLRKTLGAYRNQLIFQFFVEAFFLVFISGILAVIISYLALPYYNNLAMIPISASQLLVKSNLVALATLILLVALLTGGFPALYLSKFSALHGLNSSGFKLSNNMPFRTIMVAFQFFISIGMLTATLVINEQMDYIETKDMGFAKEEVLAIKLHKQLKLEAILYPEKLKSELEKHAGIQKVSYSSHLIGSRFSIEPTYLENDPENLVPSRFLVADRDFLETMGVTIIEGGLETKKFSKPNYFVNETASKIFQTENIIGETVVNSWLNKKGEVAGIVKDFHYSSLHNGVDPLVIELSDNQNALYYLIVRIKTSNIAGIIKTIENTLMEIAPGALLTTLLIDEHMNQSYLAEKNMFSVFKLFSTVIIALACIGLFALFAFIVQARTKEMGIRKTLGASIIELIVTLSKSYLIILVIVAMIAMPTVQLLTSSWLSGFAFRVSPSWLVYLLPSVIILVLATLAVVSQSLKVARINPVESLRRE